MHSKSTEEDTMMTTEDTEAIAKNEKRATANPTEIITEGDITLDQERDTEMTHENAAGKDNPDRPAQTPNEKDVVWTAQDQGLHIDQGEEMIVSDTEPRSIHEHQFETFQRYPLASNSNLPWAGVTKNHEANCPSRLILQRL